MSNLPLNLSIHSFLGWCGETLLSEKEVRGIVDNMGSRVGLLDFRPEKKGPFGRCMVTAWQQQGL
jgi:hypothetical protein